MSSDTKKRTLTPEQKEEIIDNLAEKYTKDDCIEVDAADASKKFMIAITLFRELHIAAMEKAGKLVKIVNVGELTGSANMNPSINSKGVMILGKKTLNKAMEDSGLTTKFQIGDEFKITADSDGFRLSKV